MRSNVLQSIAERLSDDCAACGQPAINGRRPHGYDDVHCQHCADAIEARHEWHEKGQPYLVRGWA